jgi:hypothetical protein
LSSGGAGSDGIREIEPILQKKRFSSGRRALYREPDEIMRFQLGGI